MQEHVFNYFPLLAWECISKMPADLEASNKLGIPNKREVKSRKNIPKEKRKQNREWRRSKNLSSAPFWGEYLENLHAHRKLHALKSNLGKKTKHCPDPTGRGANDTNHANADINISYLMGLNHLQICTYSADDLRPLMRRLYHEPKQDLDPHPWGYGAHYNVISDEIFFWDTR